MASKVKVDQLETLDGSGTIALQNQLSGMTTASLPTLTSTEMPAGSVLQVVHSSTDFDSSSSSNVELYSASITPSATSSKVLILFSCAIQIDSDEYAKLSIYRGSLSSGSAVFTLDDVGFHNSGSAIRQQVSGQYLDSPSTTSSQQYSIVGINIGGVTMRYGAGANNPITLIEIAG